MYSRRCNIRLHRGQHKQNKSTHRNPCLEWDSKPCPQKFKRAKTVDILDRTGTGIGPAPADLISVCSVSQRRMISTGVSTLRVGLALQSGTCSVTDVTSTMQYNPELGCISETLRPTLRAPARGGAVCCVRTSMLQAVLKIAN
jgi:hypothetical protein